MNGYEGNLLWSVLDQCDSAEMKDRKEPEYEEDRDTEGNALYLQSKTGAFSSQF